LIKQKKDLTLEEKKLDKRIQEEYHQKCDEMIIAYSTGKYAGGTDHQTSEQLRSTVVQIDNEIDWYATYQIRKKIQQGYDKKRR
jgi:predicted transcriptional regulator